MRKMWILAISFMLGFHSSSSQSQRTDAWECEVYPPEHEVTQDSVTGAKVIFVTSDSSRDVNLYFDLNSWFADLSMLAFYSERNGRFELFGYLPETGEIVRLQPAQKPFMGWATLDYQTHDIYVVRDNTICQWHVSSDLSQDKNVRSKVSIKERKIAQAPGGTSFFMGPTESADGKYLSVGLKYANSDRQDIIAVDIQTGKIQTLLTQSPSHISHVQFSKYNPYFLRFSQTPHRMWMIDIRKPGEAKKIHPQEPGEMVTHEDWWVNDQMTFCAGYEDGESHVKVVDIHTNITRIIGAGNKWLKGSKADIAAQTWWHASGSRDGRWVTADNWHGHIAIIDARTSHLRYLTMGHRTYGRGDHPHVGWAPDSKSVEFTSNKRGNSDVCIAYLPEEWDNLFVKE